MAFATDDCSYTDITGDAIALVRSNLTVRYCCGYASEAIIRITPCASQAAKVTDYTSGTQIIIVSR